MVMCVSVRWLVGWLVGRRQEEGGQVGVCGGGVGVGGDVCGVQKTSMGHTAQDSTRSPKVRPYVLLCARVSTSEATSSTNSYSCPSAHRQPDSAVSQQRTVARSTKQCCLCSEPTHYQENQWKKTNKSHTVHETAREEPPSVATLTDVAKNSPVCSCTDKRRDPLHGTKAEDL